MTLHYNKYSGRTLWYLENPASMTTLCYNVTGAERKRLADALGEIISFSPVYLRAPTFAYGVGNYTVDRGGAISCPDTVSQEEVGQIVAGLKAHGFTLESIEGSPLVVSLPRNLFSPEALDRLVQIIAGKAELFRRAFQSEGILIEMHEQRICFPWFRLHGIEGEGEAYSTFIAALGKMARQRKRITAKPYSGENDKYAMRLFLVQLGLTGAKYKLARKILLRNLSGNSAWKNGASAEREVAR